MLYMYYATHAHLLSHMQRQPHMYYATYMYKDNTHTHISSYVQWLPHICIMLRKMTKTHVYHDTYNEYHIMLRKMTKSHVQRL